MRQRLRSKSDKQLKQLSSDTKSKDTEPPSRSASLKYTPTKRVPAKKSNLKVATLEESLSRPYKHSKSSAMKEIEWDTIEIREYARTVGDNPSCSSGPPITIEWEFDPDPLLIKIDLFEQMRPPRRPLFRLMLGREERESILMDEWEISQSEIVSAIRSTIKVKNQRRRTLTNIGRVSHMEETMESLVKKFKKTMGKNTVAETKKLMEAAKQAAREDDDSDDIEMKKLPPP